MFITHDAEKGASRARTTAACAASFPVSKRVRAFVFRPIMRGLSPRHAAKQLFEPAEPSVGGELALRCYGGDALASRHTLAAMVGLSFHAESLFPSSVPSLFQAVSP